MTRSHSKKVVLLASEMFPCQLLNGYANIRQVHRLNHLFPAIFEINPDLLIIEHDFVGSKDVEKILRRVRANKFYKHIRIQCFMNERSEKAESLFKALGADQFVYREDLLKTQKQHGVMDTVHSVIDHSMIKLAASVSN